MINLSETEVQKISNSLSNHNYHWNIKATQELINLFNEISKTPLEYWKDYVTMYDDNFYTYKTFEELVKSEEEQTDGLTLEECKEQLNNSIWQLPCGWYVQYVKTR